MLIRVTQQHIDKAYEWKRQKQILYEEGYDDAFSEDGGLICNCPVALAIRDAGYPKAWAGCSTFGVGLVDGSHPLPKVAAKFISAFDLDKTVQPFEFEVEL